MKKIQTRVARALSLVVCACALSAVSADFSPKAFKPLTPFMASVDEAGRVMTVTNVDQLEYISLEKTDSNNCKFAGWYVGAEIQWPSEGLGYVLEERATHTLMDTPEFKSSIKADQFDLARNAGCGLTRKLKQMDLVGLLWGMDKTTWWTWITPEDVFYTPAGSNIVKRLTLWNNGNGAYPLGPTTFTVQIPRDSVEELRDADGVQWYPAVATNSEGRVYGDIRKALSDGGVIYPFGKLEFDKDFTFSNDVAIVLSEEGMAVAEGVTLTADATVIIIGGDSVVDAKRESFVKGEGAFKFQSGLFKFRPLQADLATGSWIEETEDGFFRVVDDGLIQISVPVAVQNLKYDGMLKTGVLFSADYTITGNTGTNAGEYVATVVPNEGRKWIGTIGDARTNAVQVGWIIQRGVREATVTITDGFSKRQGEADPKFVWEVEGLDGEDLEMFDGDCIRMAGESVGLYPFSFHCTSIPQNYDYHVTLTSANFEITENTEPDGSGKVKAPTVAFEKRRAGTTYSWTATADKGSVFLHWKGDADLLAADQNPTNDTTFKVKWDVAFSNREPQAVFELIKNDVMTFAKFDVDAPRVVVGQSVSNLVLLTDSQSKVTASVSGLPTGLKFDAKTMTVSGTTKVNLKDAASKVYKLTISAKNASGYTVKAVQYLKVFAQDSESSSFPEDPEITTKPYHALSIIFDATMGSVSGIGVYAAGSKRSISAWAKSGYVFEGWHVLGADGTFAPYAFPSGDYRKTSQSVVLDKPITLYAVFGVKTTSEDPISILPSEFRYVASGVGGAVAAKLGEVDDVWYKGVALESNIGWFFKSKSLPSVTLSGLPSGVKYDRVTAALSGVPTKAGTFTVKVSVRNVSGATATAAFKVEVRDLPTWAYGTFDGAVSTNEQGEIIGVVQSATCSNVGKLSGKVRIAGVDTAFTAANFSRFTMEGEVPTFYSVATYSAKENGKTVKKDLPFVFTLNDEGLGAVEGLFGDSNVVMMVQNPWSASDKAAVAALPKFAKNLSCVVPASLLKPGENLTFKFAGKGKVSVAGKLLGTDEKLKSVSGTTQLLIDWNSAELVSETDPEEYVYAAKVLVYLTNAKFENKAYCTAFDLTLKYDSLSNTFVLVNVDETDSIVE